MPSQQINQPSNQIKLTNVSLIRLKIGKKRFEVAAYKNTVQAYRAGHETDLDNVLQIPNVFLNVSKGQVAPNEDLKKAFPGMKREDVVLEILKRGEVQVGEKERAEELGRVHREVVEIVAGRLVDPKTKRVYTSGMIEKALEQLSSQGGHAGRQAGKGASGGSGESSSRARTPQQDRSISRDPVAADNESNSTSTTKNGDAPSTSTPSEDVNVPRKPVWKGVTTTRSAKSQALDAIKALIAYQPIPVARARMRLRITCPNSILKQTVKSTPKTDATQDADGESAPVEKMTVKEKLLSFVEQVESQDVGSEEWEVVGFVEPGEFKLLSEFVSGQTKGRARAEVLDMAVTHEGD